MKSIVKIGKSDTITMVRMYHGYFLVVFVTNSNYWNGRTGFRSYYIVVYKEWRMLCFMK